MKLKDLLVDIDYICDERTNLDIDIKGLEHNTNQVKKDFMFFCLEGKNIDGHKLYHLALNLGASVFVSNKKLILPDGVVNIIVKDTREAMAKISSVYYGYPSKDMCIVSFTGTNGKTTSTYFLNSILNFANVKTGIIGTNGVFFNNKKIVTNMTTPDPIELHKILKRMKDSGVRVVIMEMSAHALKLQKNRGLMSDIAVFTNLSQDHLDYFIDINDYGNAKKKLFKKDSSRFAILNMQDKFSSEIILDIDIPYFSFGVEDTCDFQIVNIEQLEKGQKFKLKYEDSISEYFINIDGCFNVFNAVGAIIASKKLGVDDNAIKGGLKKLKSVEGRFNSFNYNGVKFIVDFAHTPDGFENILKAKNRSLAGPTAPPQGLFLWNVDFEGKRRH